MSRARPVTVCHRGASALAPENSLAAFEAAMRYGIDFSELDVHLSADDQLVVTHDDVYQEEGRRIDVREWRAADLSVPRLADVFDLVRGRMGIYVELKGDHTGIALGKLIASGAADGVRLISGSARLELVAELRAAASDIPSSILFRPGWSVEAMIAACKQHATRYAHPCFRPPRVEDWRQTVEALHAADLLVMTPHTNEAAEALAFAEAGVDVIASDDPRVLCPLM